MGIDKQRMYLEVAECDFAFSLHLTRADTRSLAPSRTGSEPGIAVIGARPARVSGFCEGDCRRLMTCQALLVSRRAWYCRIVLDWRLEGTCAVKSFELYFERFQRVLWRTQVLFVPISRWVRIKLELDIGLEDSLAKQSDPLNLGSVCTDTCIAPQGCD